ncbi:MAG: cysteine hydrolase [Acidobacteria bacterium]|jgi:nicotinamidase/pyrazinamidase|nr:cysteine hydrolase [Acidobacteriota bacterium]
MADTIFWDCGSQLDLADLDGLLYVDGASTIRPKLARLARHARERGIPRLITRVAHREGDPDLATEKPDFKTTFPAHCLEGTAGAGPIPETAPARAVELGREDQGERSIRDALRAYQGEVVLEVAGFDPFAHPAIGIVLDELKPRRAVVYGVPADRMVAAVVNGLLERGVEVVVVEDAVKPFGRKAWDAVREGWAGKPVAFVKQQDATA